MDVAEVKRTVDTLRPGYWYLASPYSRYPKGIEQAFIDISKIGGTLIKAGVPVFCPIAHSHPVAIHGDIEPSNHDVWLPLDFHMMRKAVGIIVAKMETWDTSYGVSVEIDFFTKAGLPVIYLEV
jgi:hypothetical protein